MTSGRTHSIIQLITVAIVTFSIPAAVFAAGPWRIVVDAGAYTLPDDELAIAQQRFFIDHIAGGVSIETRWLTEWRFALDVSRHNSSPYPVTTYADPYGASGLTFTPQMYTYVWSVQIGSRLNKRVVSTIPVCRPCLCCPAVQFGFAMARCEPRGIWHGRHGRH